MNINDPPFWAVLFSTLLCKLLMDNLQYKQFPLWGTPPLCSYTAKLATHSQIWHYFEVFCPTACYHSVQNILSSSLLSKNLKIKIAYTELKFCLLFCMGVKLGRSHWGCNVGWGCLRTGCWGEYLGLRGTRYQGSEENYIMRSLMICNPRPILFGW